MISKDWAEYTAVFPVTGGDCDASNNRFMFATGKINGTLWIANFSLIPYR